MLKTYSELSKLKTYEDRFNYLKLDGLVGIETFGYDRYLNQILYKTREWKQTRDIVIIRDMGCDLGVEGHEIHGPVLIHHMNPITKEQIINRDPIIFDPEFLITTYHKTHNAIHYGDSSVIPNSYTERKANDTKLW